VQVGEVLGGHDPKLTWKLHVDAKCNKALAAFYQVRNATGKTWGTSLKVVHWIYTILIFNKADAHLCGSNLVATSQVYHCE